MGIYLETINAIVEQSPDLRGHLAAAWRVGWEWRGLVPALNHRPATAPVVQAIIAAALLEEAEDLALLVAVAFAACLRPAEMMALKVGEILLPSRTLGRQGAFYVAIGRPKMRRLSARREHVLVEQLSLTQWLETALAGRSADELLFRAGPRVFTAAFAEVVRVLGLPVGDLRGLTPASLRAGGATWLFETTRDLELVRWRGRWASNRTLEVYIQEVAADRLLADVGDDVRSRVRRLAASAPGLVRLRTALTAPPR